MMKLKKVDQLTGKKKGRKLSFRERVCGCYHCTEEKGDLARSAVKRKIIEEELKFG